MEYTVDYFIKKFEAIPEGNWYMNDYCDLGRTKFCAYGHCGFTTGKETSREGDALGKIIAQLQTNVPCVNDSDHNNYQQPTPKQRILAALYDIKAKQDEDIGKVEYPDLTKQLAVLPIEETTDKIQQPA